MLGQPKAGKVAGSQRRVSGAHGEGGPRRYLRESVPPTLQRRPPVLRCRDQASPRGPTAAAAAARRAGWPATVRLSFPLRRTGRWSHGRGGAERAGLAGWPWPRGSQPRPPPGLGRGAGIAAAGCGVWRCHQVAGLRGGAAAGARPRLDPNAQSPPGRRACPGRSRSARTPPAGAPSRSGSIATPREAARPPPRGPQGPALQTCRAFPGKSRGPNLFQNKVRGRRRPRVLPASHRPAAGSPEHRADPGCSRSVPPLTGSEAGLDRRPEQKGFELGPLPTNGRGARPRAIGAEAEVEALSRTSARAACGPEALLAPLQ